MHGLKTNTSRAPLTQEASWRLGYMTTDEVNQDLAKALALKCGALVSWICPGAVCPSEGFDAALIDLDAIPRLQRPSLLASVVAKPSACPKGIHGYSLGEKQAKLLHLKGVAIAQHLCIELLCVLCQAVLKGLTTVPPDDSLMDATWVGAPPANDEKIVRQPPTIFVRPIRR